MDDLVAFIRHKVVQRGLTLEHAQLEAEKWAGAESARRATDLVRAEIQRVTMVPDPFYIAGEDRSDWYPGPQPGDRFWEAYLKQLVASGWHGDDIRALDRSSSRVLQLMKSPGASKIRTRGLVVGYVQSGKTANYAATIAKAADAGYRLIVVLAGATNVLRRQTQERLIRDLVVNAREKWELLTDDKQDFSGGLNAAASLTADSSQRTIAVIKKNKHRMKRLSDWLASAGESVLGSCAMLVVDDEADQASPNSAKEVDERTAINGALLRLLATGPKAAYVGFTATPFANLLIDPANPEDLYPRDFIVDLPRPPKYFGAERLFGRGVLSPIDAETPADGLDMIREVPDSDIGESLVAMNEGRRSRATDSLRDAIRYFVLATAERHRRGQGGLHSSMLIHTSQRIAAHRNLVGIVERELSVLRETDERATASLRTELSALWASEIERVEVDGSKPAAFPDIEPHLEEVVSRVRVVVENSASVRRLDYNTPGQIVVAIGGNVLARGLTLEGLSVSYFVRTASAYDSLLQMGRWFGFRPGYADLPRVWMTEELRGFFFDLATVEAEIRQEIARYEQDPSITPITVGVRIRTHPKLAITAKAKMRSAVKAAMSYRGRRLQTTLFPVADAQLLASNVRAMAALIATASKTSTFAWDESASAFISRGQNVGVVRDFLTNYQFLPHAEWEQRDLLLSYLSARDSDRTIRSWNVAVASRSKNSYGTTNVEPLGAVNLVRRGRAKARPSIVGVSIGALMSERDSALDCLASIAKPAEIRDYLAERHLRAGPTGLLVVYPIAPNAPVPAQLQRTRAPLEASDVVVGVALVFPDVDDGQPLSYFTADLSRVPREAITSLSELADSDDAED